MFSCVVQQVNLLYNVYLYYNNHFWIVLVTLVFGLSNWFCPGRDNNITCRYTGVQITFSCSSASDKASSSGEKDSLMTVCVVNSSFGAIPQLIKVDSQFHTTVGHNVEETNFFSSYSYEYMKNIHLYSKQNYFEKCSRSRVKISQSS